MDERHILAHRVVDVMYRANTKFFVTLLRYNVEKPESSYARDQIISRKDEDEKTEQIVYLEEKNYDFIYPLYLVNSIYDKVLTKKTHLFCPKKIIATFYSLPFFIVIES